MKSLCRHILLVLAFCLTGSTFAHAQDYRARIYPRGYIEKISVLPDESIWLGTRVGEMYYTNRFEESWHYKFRSDDLISYDHYREVMGFTNGTMLVVGQISSDGGYQPDAVLRSTDRGKNWSTVKFTELKTMQVQASDHNSRGEVWIGGGPGRFFYSWDFGNTWEERTAPYAGATRVYAIEMVSGSFGFVGSHDGKLSRTDDNGKSWWNIPTPYQQGMYSLAEKHWTKLQIDKIGVSGRFIVVRQGQHIFYSDATDIAWKRFDSKLVDFAIDRRTSLLTAIDNKGEVIFYDGELKPLGIADGKIDAPLDMAAVDGTVYAIDHRYNIYRATRDAVSKTMLLTEDYPIESPAVQRKATVMKWGATGIDLYNASYNNNNWYRIRTFDFPIADIRLLNDDEAILWDGDGANYYYNRVKDSIAVYTSEGPITDFLKHKIERFEIHAWSQGCFHSYSSMIGYSLSSDNEFVVEKFVDQDKGEKKWRSSPTVPYDMIGDLLQEINDAPAKSFTVGELDITDQDRSAYQSLVARARSSDINEWKKSRIAYYRDAPAHLDTIKAATMSTLLGSPMAVWSTTTNGFTVIFYNSRGDQVSFTNVSYRDDSSFFLPWQLNYEATHVNITNPKFSNVIRQLIPATFMFAEGFNKARLLYQVVDGCYWRENRPAEFR